MEGWVVSSETGGQRLAPVKVQLLSRDRVALMLPAWAPVLSHEIWSLTGPGISWGALFRTISTRRARTPGMMVLKGVRVVDEGRSMENRTIDLIRDLLDLEVVDVSPARPRVPAGCLHEEAQQVCG